MGIGSGTGKKKGIAKTWFQGKWIEGDQPIFSSMSHAVWQSSLIFDGARAFEGVAPDLLRHCQRAVNSAQKSGMSPHFKAEDIYELAWEGIDQIGTDQALYVRPMFWTEGGFVVPDPDTTEFCIVVNQLPMPDANGFSACISSRRRPPPDMAPTDTKAACLYPNSGRALQESWDRGFQNALMLDAVGNIAEFATANVFMVKDGEIATPTPNGSFLNGITRQRIINLMAENGKTVSERQITTADLADADEIFSTGNFGKVIPVNRFEDRELQPGPVAKLARDLYWDFAHKTGRK